MLMRDREKTTEGAGETGATFRLLASMRLSAVWFVCCLLAWCLYQRWMVTAAWFTCWMNLQIHERTGVSHRAAQHSTWTAIDEETLSDLSASSSVTSLLRGSTGLPRWADTGDLLLEVEDVEEKFFWDLVREPPSSDTSSFAVAFRMLLEEDVIDQMAINILQDQHR